MPSHYLSERKSLEKSQALLCELNAHFAAAAVEQQGDRAFVFIRYQGCLLIATSRRFPDYVAGHHGVDPRKELERHRQRRRALTQVSEG